MKRRNGRTEAPEEGPPGEVHKIDHPFLREVRAAAVPQYTSFDYDYFDNPAALTGYRGYDGDQNGADGARDFEIEAGAIADLPGVRTVLDVGCAKGYLVSALRRSGVEAYGVDASSYVLETANPAVRPHLRRVRIQDLPLTESYDLVHLDGILEYLTRSEIVSALGRLREIARIGILAHSATSEQIRTWYDRGDWTAVDPLRKQEISRREWDELFASAGFRRDGILFKKDPAAGPTNGKRPRRR
jgi:2-polyprenyl-3-methyl-5-hydroxy-6-metoxy-1,4-benzoquinol methylase